VLYVRIVNRIVVGVVIVTLVVAIVVVVVIVARTRMYMLVLAIDCGSLH
jgi:hypothetical protein